VSRRLLLAVGAAVGISAVALSGLAALGTDPTAADADGWTGWTGRVDSSVEADKAAMTPDDASALRLLARSAGAASTVAYAGRVVSRGRAGTVTTDLLHVPGRGTVATTPGQTGTPAQFAPDGRSGSFADDGRPLALLSVNYRVLRDAELDTPVAGRPTDAVVAVDTSGAVAARYWVDRATGLLLRKEIVDSSGRVWSQAGFATFDATPATPSAMPTQAADAWSEPLDSAALGKARQRGCACPESLPGGLTLLDAREAPAGAVASEPVVHQLFSDGLVTVSLFSLEGELTDDDTAGLVARGFTRTELGGWYAWMRGGSAAAPTVTVVWECRGSVLTLVSEDALEPVTLASSVLAALPPAEPDVDSSLAARIARGWQRITGDGS
jgi:sigma-E factor negative regulatory protein RseB